jgi:hypothetical protein
MKLLIGSFIALIMLSGCNLFQDDAKIASKNLSKAADNFEIDRRIVFYNGITNEYMLEIRGKCSIENMGNRISVTCKVKDSAYGSEAFKKHFLGLSDNVTYFAEQMESASVSKYHYRVTFKPQAIVPDIDFRGDVDAAVKAVTPDKRD